MKMANKLKYCLYCGAGYEKKNSGADEDDYFCSHHCELRYVDGKDGVPFKVISTHEEMVQLAIDLGVRDSWHEPDEQDIKAVTRGGILDNAGFWGDEYRFKHRDYEWSKESNMEMWVDIIQGDVKVAEINLAMLLAWASGFKG